MNAIICRTGEIYLKRGNRKNFEVCLLNNVRRFLKDNNIKHDSATMVGSRILIYNCTDTSVKNVCGLTSVSPVSIAADCTDIEKAKELLLKIAKENDIENKTFKIQCQRTNKNFPHKSPDVQKILGEMVLDEFDTKAEMKNPDLKINVDIIGNGFFFFTEKIPAVGGLPVGMGGKSISLLSGGIDSPVASFLMMKRGCQLIYVHFESKPYTTKESDEKVIELMKKLNKFQFESKLYMIPFADIQKKLSLTIKTSLMVIFYRKIMLYIAEMVKDKEKYESICTGDNLGQVASQTMANIAAVQEHCDSLILRPLTTYDKEEIIKIAIGIDTFDISKLPFDDCCTLFNPKLPETRAKMPEINEFWEKIQEEGLLDMAKQAFENAEIIEYSGK